MTPPTPMMQIRVVDQHVADRMREARVHAGLTQREVAKRTGVEPQQTHNREMGNNRVSAGVLWQVARALDVPVSWFFDGLEEPRLVPPRSAVAMVKMFTQMSPADRALVLAFGRQLAEGDR